MEDKCHVVAGKGLSVEFLHRVVTAIFATQHSSGHDVKVLMYGPSDMQPEIKFRALTTSDRPIHAPTLIDQHWVLVHCELQSECLRMTVDDGLGLHVSRHVHNLCDVLKTSWALQQVNIEYKWILPQKQQHTCGTVALGHLLLLAGIISSEQAMNFEQLHDGLAHCDPFQQDAMQVGFAPDEAIVEALMQILPSNPREFQRKRCRIVPWQPSRSLVERQFNEP
jgi:hypothetical protein